MKFLCYTDEFDLQSISTQDSDSQPFSQEELIVAGYSETAETNSEPSSQVLLHIAGDSENDEDVEERNDPSYLPDILEISSNSENEIAENPINQPDGGHRIASSKAEEAHRAVTGRPLDPIWNCFTIKRNEHQKILGKAVCNKCKSEVSPQPHRMKIHYKKCNKPKKQVVPQPSVDLRVPATVSEEKNNKASNIKQQSMNNYVQRITNSNKAKLDNLLAKFLFSSDTAFVIVENPWFKAFLKEMNPSYQLPSHDTIGGRILNEVYSEILTEMSGSLKNATAVLLQDGWSTNQNDPIIGHLIWAGGKSYCLSSVSAGSREKTADLCLEFFEAAKILAESKFQCKIVGLITDNAASMKALQKKVKEKFPDLEAYGCESHLYNLLGAHFTPLELKEAVSFVQAFFRNRQMAGMELKSLEGRRPVMPCSTRWNSEIDSFINFKDNAGKYLQIIRNSSPKTKDDKEKFEKVRKIVSDDDLFVLLEETLQNLTPICKALDKVQKRIFGLGTF